jgi:predicted nucleic acid-binding protein
VARRHLTPVHERALLDTSVVIDYPASAVAAQASTAAVSTITLAELSYGLHTADPLLNAAREQRYHWITNTFDPIPFDTRAARIYGALCATVRAVGRNPKPRRFDLLIAAVAVALNIPLITRNEADFAGIHDSLTVIAVG